MYDLISIGEMLIDFTPYNTKESDSPLFQLNPGGAPANVACVLAKLGLKTSFIGKVGNDSFGLMCKDALEDAGCNSSNLVLSPDYNTTLAFVTLTSEGDRSFSFYRNNTTADTNLNIEEISDDLYSSAKLFHFGSVSLTQEPSRSTTIEAVKRAKGAGCIISYDPNLRAPLWSSLENAKTEILEMMPLADLVKISDEEQEFLFPGANEDDAAHQLIDQYGIKFLVITKAKQGCVAYINGKKYTSHAYDVKTIDTTGAGDAFWSGILLRLLEYGKPISSLTDSEITDSLSYANAIGSLVTTKLGAIAAIPSKDEIIKCMQDVPLLV